MSREFTRQETLLRNLYTSGPAGGHAFSCRPPRTPVWSMPHGEYTLSSKPVNEWLSLLVHDYELWCGWARQLKDDSVPLVDLTMGTHLYAAAFGSPVHQYPDNNPAAMPFIRTADEADRLAEPDIWKSPTLYRVFEMVEAVVRELGSEVPISVPDCQSGFDTASLIWDKTTLFLAMLDPEGKEAVKRLAGKCARLFKEFIRALRREFPQMTPCHCPAIWMPPELGPWVSNDECGIVNTAMFEEFMLPELLDLAATFGGLGMHCCAAAEHQFPAFARIPNFYGFNRVVAPNGPGYEVLFDHFHPPCSPVYTLAWVDVATTCELIRKAPTGTRFAFVEFSPSLEEAKTWLEQVRRAELNL